MILSANKFLARGCKEDSVVVTIAGQRRSMIEGIVTCVIASHSRAYT